SSDPVNVLPWVLLAAVAVAAFAMWRRSRPARADALVEATVTGATPPQGAPAGRDYKLAIGSAGVKSIVREARMEEAYQVRLASETAFEAFADFDTQQERIAMASRPAGP